MEALVKVENNQIVTDSRSVAEHFGKQHKMCCRRLKISRLKIQPPNFFSRKQLLRIVGSSIPCIS